MSCIIKFLAVFAIIWLSLGFIACKIITLSGKISLSGKEAKRLLFAGPFGLALSVFEMVDQGDFNFISKKFDDIGQKVADIVNKNNE